MERIKMNKRHNDLTQEYLKSILSYDPETGLFIRLITSSSNAIKGDTAGYIHDGYVNIKINGKAYKAHRLAWLYMTGEWPEDEIDHINGITHYNVWNNLREATHHQNCKNRKLNINNASGFKGVHKEKNKWRASVNIDKIQVFIGLFNTPEEAYDARMDYVSIHYGEFARKPEHE
jgi:hypothetical protein